MQSHLSTPGSASRRAEAAIEPPACITVLLMPLGKVHRASRSARLRAPSTARPSSRLRKKTPAPARRTGESGPPRNTTSIVDSLPPRGLPTLRAPSFKTSFTSTGEEAQRRRVPNSKPLKMQRRQSSRTPRSPS